MFQVSVKNESNGYSVVVRNPQTGYTFVGKSHAVKASGPFGPNPVEHAEAFDRAQADASDWVAKFKRAHIKAEVVA